MIGIRKKMLLAWLACALFFGAQALVAQHNAEFGPQKHSHHAHPCDIQLFADHAKAPSLPTVPSIAVPTVVANAKPIGSVTAFLARRVYTPSLARAPPSPSPNIA